MIEDMLDIEYKKDIYGNYMIAGVMSEEELTYGMKMHLNNKIKGLLDVELHITDNKKELYYNITSKQSIVSFLDREQLKYKELKHILKGIISAIENGKEFLLNEDDFIINSEYIYINLSEMEISLCHYSGYSQDLTKQISNFIEYLMNRVDYSDEQAVIMIYGLYKISKETNGVLENLKKFIDAKPSMKSKEEEELKDKKNAEELGEREDYEARKRIPSVREFNTDTREVLCYSGLTVLAGVLSVLTLIIVFFVMWRFEFFTNITNIFGAGLVFITAEIFILSKLFSKKNKISKLKTVEEDISSIGQEEWIKEDNPTTLLNENKEEKTVLLNSTNQKASYKLRAENTENYQDILIIEFPFFIGKLKTRVNCSIDNAAVSRFHAKIELLKEKYYITDLNSTNGTYLNGIRLEPNETRELNIDEKVSFANVSYFFVKN